MQCVLGICSRKREVLCLMKLSVAKIAYGRWQMNESRVRCIGGMMVAGKGQSTPGKKRCCFTNLSATCPASTGVGSKRGNYTVSVKHNRLIIILEFFGQHVSTPIESSSGPSRIRSKIKRAKNALWDP